MKHNMLGASIIFALLLSGCKNTEYKAADQTTGAAVTEMAAIEATVTEFATEIAAADAGIRKESEAGAEVKMEILIGDKTYAVSLEENETAKELAARLPMEFTMEELHGNEKYYYLPESLPAAAEAIGTIQTGDLMLFGSDCLVLFYEDFETTYTYTRIGRLENPSGLAETLGSGSVTVTFKR